MLLKLVKSSHFFNYLARCLIKLQPTSTSKSKVSSWIPHQHPYPHSDPHPHPHPQNHHNRKVALFTKAS